jgi:hypothetical protein
MVSFSLLYGILVLSLCVGAFFVIFHILRYSLTDSLGYFGVVFFGVVFFLLLFINFLSFQNLRVDEWLPELSSEKVLPSATTLPSLQKNNPW